MATRGLGTMVWEVGRKDKTFCLTACHILFLKNNNEGCISSSWPPSVVSDVETKPYYAEQIWREAEGGRGERDNSCEVGFFWVFLFVFLNSIRDLIIISLLAGKTSKWQEKESQLNINTHTLIHTKMKGLRSFKVTANFPGFKRVSEEDIDNECAFSTGSLINFPPFHLLPQNRFSFLFRNMEQTELQKLTSRWDLA